jgi:ubiquinone/menaquinone biosynthesis C-methylase UbiE
VFPRLMDRVLDTPTVNVRRAKVCQGLHGRVLEIGFGTGLNLNHYPAAVTEILVVEPSESAMRLAQPREATASAPVERIGRDGARLALPDGSVDCVLSTYTLCTISAVDAALREVHRVLKPEGVLHFLRARSRADGIRTPLAAPAASGSQPDRWWLPSRPADR